MALAVSLVAIVVCNSPLAVSKVTSIKVYDDPNPIWSKDLPKLFMKKNPDIRVQFIPSITSVEVLYAGGTAPDVMQLSPEQYDSFRQRGMLLPIDAYMKRSRLSQDDFNTNYKKWYFGGKLFGLPVWTGMGAAMITNVSMFKSIGMPPPDNEWRWPNLIEAVQKLTLDTNHDGTPDRYGIEWPDLVGDPICWLTLVWQNGGEFYNAAETQCTMDSKAAVEATGFYADLKFRYNAFLPGEGFYKQKAGMLWSYAFMDRLKSKDFEVSSAPLPYMTEKAIGAQALRSYAICSTTKKADAAFRYMSFVLTDPDAVKLTAAFSTPSSRIGMKAWRQVTPKEIVSRFDSGWLERLEKYSHPRPFDAKWTKVLPQAVLPEMGRLMSGKVQAQVAMASLVKQTNRILVEFNARMDQRRK